MYELKSINYELRVLIEPTTFTLHCGDFSLFFYFLFSVFYFLSFTRTKSTKTPITESVTFCPLDVFKCIFYFIFACSVLYFWLVAFLRFLCFLYFLCFWCVQNLFVKKKNKKFKISLITSFILLLNLSYYKHEFFNHYNLFQSLKSFSIITIFFNYHDLFQLPWSSLLKSFLS